MSSHERIQRSKPLILAKIFLATFFFDVFVEVDIVNVVAVCDSEVGIIDES
jgi:hypothetical protein